MQTYLIIHCHEKYFVDKKIAFEMFQNYCLQFIVQKQLLYSFKNNLRKQWQHFDARIGTYFLAIFQLRRLLQLYSRTEVTREQRSKNI